MKYVLLTFLLTITVFANVEEFCNGLNVSQLDKDSIGILTQKQYSFSDSESAPRAFLYAMEKKGQKLTDPSLQKYTIYLKIQDPTSDEELFSKRGADFKLYMNNKGSLQSSFAKANRARVQALLKSLPNCP